MIMNAKKNPNFPQMVKYLDMELPEQEVYCPPLTIRVLDCRFFPNFLKLLISYSMSVLSKLAENAILKMTLRLFFRTTNDRSYRE